MGIRAQANSDSLVFSLELFLVIHGETATNTSSDDAGSGGVDPFGAKAAGWIVVGVLRVTTTTVWCIHVHGNVIHGYSLLSSSCSSGVALSYSSSYWSTGKNMANPMVSQYSLADALVVNDVGASLQLMP
jgi:hypothetical protein